MIDCISAVPAALDHYPYGFTGHVALIPVAPLLMVIGQSRKLKPDDAELARYFLGVFAARYALLQASAIPIQAIGLLAGQLPR